MEICFNEFLLQLYQISSMSGFDLMFKVNVMISAVAIKPQE